jgi:hypothetical protein
MRKQFSLFYGDAEYDFDSLWDEAIISFDTNVLLNLYAYNAESRDEWYTALKKIKEEGRLFLPYQIAYEYHLGIAGRIRQARDLKTADTEFAVSLPEVSVLKKGSLLINSSKVAEEMINMRTETQKKLTKITNEYQQQFTRHVKDWQKGFDDDWKSVRDQIAEIFEGVVAKRPSEKTIQQRCHDAESRFVQNIPPGYSDREKAEKDLGNQYGDALFWFELKDAAKDQGKPILLVTNELKPDWWLIPEKKQRPELASEMYADTGYLFQLATAKRFVEWMSKVGKATESVVEVERVRSQQKAHTEALSQLLKMFPPAGIFISTEAQPEWAALSDIDRARVYMHVLENVVGKYTFGRETSVYVRTETSDTLVISCLPQPGDVVEIKYIHNLGFLG